MKYVGLNTITPAKLTEMIVEDQELKLLIAENMQKYGGSFVQALAECFFRADLHNLKILSDSFMFYVLEYLPENWSKK